MASDENMKVVVEQKEEKSIWNRIQDTLRRRNKLIMPETDRAKKMGFFQYPKKNTLDVRMATMITILEQMDQGIDELGKSVTERDLYKNQSKQIFNLYRMFQMIGGPWMRGLDDRELARKVQAYFELEILIGHLPAFYSDIRYLTKVLIHYSFKAMDMGPFTPVLFETRATIQPGNRPFKMGQMEPLDAE